MESNLLWYLTWRAMCNVLELIFGGVLSPPLEALHTFQRSLNIFLVKLTVKNIWRLIRLCLSSQYDILKLKECLMAWKSIKRLSFWSNWQLAAGYTEVLAHSIQIVFIDYKERSNLLWELLRTVWLILNCGLPWRVVDVTRTLCIL